MNDRQDQVPGEAAGDGRAQHGYQNEVNWEGGKGQPYANQGNAPQVPAAGRETEAGNRGEASGRNLEQMERLQRQPGPVTREAQAGDAPGEGDVR